MLIKTLTISRNTWTEAIRQPIFIVLVVGATLLLLFNLLISNYTLGDDGKLLVDLGLSTIFIAGLLLAAFTATRVVSSEIESGTLLNVLSKPVARPAFVLGKFLGIIYALTMALWNWSFIFLLTLRQGALSPSQNGWDGPVITFTFTAILLALALSTALNYLYNQSFNSSFSFSLAALLPLAYFAVLCLDPNWQWQHPLSEFRANDGELGQFIIALILILEALILLSAVALACSTRLGQGMTLLICLLFFFLGLSNDYIFGRFIESSTFAWLGYTAFPNLQYFWLADSLTQRNPISFSYFIKVTLYCLLYSTFVLSIGTLLFRRREAA